MRRRRDLPAVSGHADRTLFLLRGCRNWCRAAPTQAPQPRQNRRRHRCSRRTGRARRADRRAVDGADAPTSTSSRIAVTNPAVADAVVVQPREILVDGKSPGTVSLIVWGADRSQAVRPRRRAGDHHAAAAAASAVPGEDIAVSATDEAIILSGACRATTSSLRAAEIAQASSSKAKVINMLQLPGGQESQQVMLQVRFAEVNRRALTELGVSCSPSTAQDYAGARDHAAVRGARLRRATRAAAWSFSDFLNLFFFNREEGIGGARQGAAVERASSRASPSRT